MEPGIDGVFAPKGVRTPPGWRSMAAAQDRKAS
jgi:hypothetical protein